MNSNSFSGSSCEQFTHAVYAVTATPCNFKVVNVTTKNISACELLQSVQNAVCRPRSFSTV